MSIATSSRIAVIGGGIGGMAAALAFARNGHGVTLFEQSSALSEVGAGLQITPNGARALAAIGALDAVVARAVRAEGAIISDGLRGHALMNLPGANNKTWLFLHRADLLGALVDQARSAGVTIITGMRQTSDTLDADLVVAADGVHSTHRSRLDGDSGARFSGLVAWRATVPSDSAAQVARIWIAPRAHVVAYPLRGGELVNLVAVSEAAHWGGEGWAEPADRSEFRQTFERFAPVVQNLLSRAETVTRWGLAERGVANIWHDKRLVLLGDAAHPTLPFLAQGANMALEDAAVLSHLWDRERANALASYQSLRRARTARIVAASSRNGRLYHLGGIPGWIARRGLGLLPSSVLARQLSWIHDYSLPHGPVRV